MADANARRGDPQFHGRGEGDVEGEEIFLLMEVRNPAWEIADNIQ